MVHSKLQEFKLYFVDHFCLFDGNFDLYITAELVEQRDKIIQLKLVD
tara:strand:+ start:3007 stop:3147 length:141 start_codon:yes stop_codon:yes gene_type:complete